MRAGEVYGPLGHDAGGRSAEREFLDRLTFATDDVARTTTQTGRSGQELLSRVERRARVRVHQEAQNEWIEIERQFGAP